MTGSWLVVMTGRHYRHINLRCQKSKYLNNFVAEKLDLEYLQYTYKANRVFLISVPFFRG